MQIINLTENLPAGKEGNKLNEFVIRASGSFLESYEWGDFQEQIGGKIWRLGVEDDNGELVGVATLIKKKLPFGKNYFYCPRGPISHNIEHLTRNINFLFSEIKKIAESEKVIFLRFELLTPYKPQATSYKLNKTIDVQPSKTLILDLLKTEEEILKAMHEKTRYNIRLAEKKGVNIVEAGQEKFDDFWNLIDQTSGRDKFRLHGRNYYKAMLEINPPNPLYQGGGIRLFFAEYQNKLIATGIFSFFGDTVTYLHGGSSNEFRNVMAPYLLQWEVIKKAKAEGYKYYDLFGIDEKKWPGVTRFKKGFARLDLAEPRRSGNEVNYSGTFDLIFNKAWYNIYKMIRKIKRFF